MDVSLYVSDPEDIVEEEERIGDWRIIGVESQCKNDAIFSAILGGHGLEGTLKLNRHATKNPRMRKPQMSWFNEKMRRSFSLSYQWRVVKNKMFPELRIEDYVEREKEIYFMLTERSADHIPMLLDFGIWRGHSYIVLEKYGESVGSKIKSHGPLRVSEVCAIGMRVVKALKQLHALGYIHRNISDDALFYDVHNVNQSNQKVYLMMYEQAKKVKPLITMNKGERDYIGSCLFAPVAAHRREHQLKKDDMESLAYLLSFLHIGALPWSAPAGMRDWCTTGLLKAQFKSKISTQMSKMPREFTVVFDYIFKLLPHSNIDYGFVISVLRSVNDKYADSNEQSQSRSQATLVSNNGTDSEQPPQNET